MNAVLKSTVKRVIRATGFDVVRYPPVKRAFQFSVGLHRGGNCPLYKGEAVHTR